MPDDEGYKFVDDTSFLEVLNLLLVGLASLNPKIQVPSDVPPEMAFLPEKNCDTQNYLNKMVKWTEEKEMQLNPLKSKYMIINFCRSYQFKTRLFMNNQLLEQVHETGLLGLLIQDDLSWKSNTKNLVKRAYSRMIILRKLIEFDVKTEDMITIYILFIRSIVEQSSVVWSSALTTNELSSLERTQKVALRLIYNKNYISYENALEKAKLPSIANRFETLLLRFSIKCMKNEQTRDMLPLVKNSNRQRNQEIVEVPLARKTRFFKSTIPTMARIMNKHLSNS